MRRGRCVAAALIVSLSACGSDDEDDRIVPTPTPIQSGQPLIVTGTVFDFSAPNSPRPVSNLRLRVSKGNFDGAVNSQVLTDVVTDAHGRYTLEGQSQGVLFFQTDPAAEYRFLCPAYPILVGFPGSFVPGGFSGFDLPVVHATWSGSTLPTPWSPFTSVSGAVFERIGGGLQGVAGATVTLDGGAQDPPSTTSDSGFYMICSITGTDQERTITVRKDGYRQITRTIFGGWDYDVDFELVRN